MLFVSSRRYASSSGENALDSKSHIVIVKNLSQRFPLSAVSLTNLQILDGQNSKAVIIVIIIFRKALVVQ